MNPPNNPCAPHIPSPNAATSTTGGGASPLPTPSQPKPDVVEKAALTGALLNYVWLLPFSAIESFLASNAYAAMQKSKNDQEQEEAHRRSKALLDKTNATLEKARARHPGISKEGIKAALAPDLEIAPCAMYWKDLAEQIATVWWRCHAIGASLQHGDLDKATTFTVVCEKHGGQCFHAGTPMDAWRAAEKWLMSPDRQPCADICYPLVPDAAELGLPVPDLKGKNDIPTASTCPNCGAEAVAGNPLSVTFACGSRVPIFATRSFLMLRSWVFRCQT